MNVHCQQTSTEELVHGIDLVDVWSIDAGLQTATEMVANSAPFKVVDDDGNLIGFFALLTQNLPAGSVDWLVAGQGRVPGIDLTRDLLPVIEQHSPGKVMAIQTTRPGLVKKLISQGYHMGGFILWKKTHD